jgi:hypothetical protein
MHGERTQDTIDENETVLEDFDDGARLIEVVDKESYRDRESYRIETPFDSDSFEFTSEKRARLWFDLYRLVGGFAVPQAGAIPHDVGLEGTPAIACWLYAVEGFDSESVADSMGIKRRTVWDYFSEIRDRRRRRK